MPSREFPPLRTTARTRRPTCRGLVTTDRGPASSRPHRPAQRSRPRVPRSRFSGAVGAALPKGASTRWCLRLRGMAQGRGGLERRRQSHLHTRTESRPARTPSTTRRGVRFTRCREHRRRPRRRVATRPLRAKQSLEGGVGIEKRRAHRSFRRGLRQRTHSGLRAGSLASKPQARCRQGHRPDRLGDHMIARRHDRRTIDSRPTPFAHWQSAMEAAPRPLLAAGPPPYPLALRMPFHKIPTDSLLPLGEPPSVGADRQVVFKGPMASDLAIGVPQRRNPMPLVAAFRPMVRLVGGPPVVPAVEQQRRGEQRERRPPLATRISRCLHQDFPSVLEPAPEPLVAAGIPADQFSMQAASSIFGLLRSTPASVPPFSEPFPLARHVTHGARRASTRVGDLPQAMQFSVAENSLR